MRPIALIRLREVPTDVVVPRRWIERNGECTRIGYMPGGKHNQRRFAAWFNFIGWHCLSFGIGVHIDTRNRYIDIHLPGGFARIGWNRISAHLPGVTFNEKSAAVEVTPIERMALMNAARTILRPRFTDVRSGMPVRARRVQCALRDYDRALKQRRSA